MSPWQELDEAVRIVQRHGVPLAVLQCTTAYPCPPDKVGLNLMQEFRNRYRCSAGLSDHSGTIYPALAAATLCADVIEVHVTLSREMFGPDVIASVTTTELRQLVEGVRFIERMRAHPLDKNAMAAETEHLRKLFTKSVVATRTLEAGTVLQPGHLAAKKPGTGIPANRLPELVGRKLRRRVEADTLLNEDDLERN